jgi:fucose permease
MIVVVISLAIVVVGATIYFAWKSRDFRKFLAGAFFVSAGIQFYLYLADVSVPVLGTDFEQTPRLSAARSVPHFVLFLVTLYFGFIRKPKASTS